MSLLRADRVANRFNNTGPIIVGPSTVHGDFTVTGNLIAAGIAVTESIQIGAALTVRDLNVQQQATVLNLEVTGVGTFNTVNSSNYFGNGSGLVGIVTTITASRGIVINPSNGKGTVQISAVDVVESGFANVAAGATNLLAGDAGRIPYQTAPNATGFTSTGNVGEILFSGGTGSPTWGSVADINVSFADSAGISTNIFGGSGGRLLYQSAIDQTDFVPVGATGRILQANGSGTPSWLDADASDGSGLSVAYAIVSGVATNVTGGIASVTHLSVGQNGSGIATFYGPIQGVNINLTGVTTTGTLEVSTAATIPSLTLSTNPGVGVTAILDEDDMVSDRVDALATQQSIKKYVDDQVTAQDLDGTADDGIFAVDLDSQTLDLRGDANQVYVTASGQQVNIGFTTDVTIANDLTVTGNAGIGSLNVSGISTLGVTTATSLSLNELIVAGFTTTSTINVGNLESGIGITMVTSGDAIFAGVITAAGINVSGDGGDVQFDNVNIDGNAGIGSLNVTGISTFTDINVTGNAGIGSLNVTGIATFTDINVTGNAGIGSLNVTGISTFSDITVTGNAGIGSLNVTGISTFTDINATGNAGIGSLNVTGISTFGDINVTGVTSLGVATATSLSLNELIVSGFTTTGTLNVGGFATVGGGASTLSIGATIENYGGAIFAGIITAAGLDISGGDSGNVTFNDITVTGNAGIGSLVVSGVSTLGYTTISDLYVSGSAAVGTGITMDGATGIITATAFYGDGSNLTNVQGVVAITNQLYVTPDGNDANDGLTPNTAKRTIGSATTVAKPTTVINISAGTYVEDNPVVLPEQTTILGDSLREVSIIPRNRNADLIYVSNGSYVENMTFSGTLNEGKAIISFNPEKPSFVTQGPYIRNCTNFISNSIGMKIDGANVIGPTRAMNVDSYTQLNQGGIGVSISNEGYAQLVSIFTIYNDQSIVCVSGGQCDLTNSNSSFGRLGLVADGIGPTNFIGTIPQFVSADSSVIPIDLSVENFSVENAVYDQFTGLTTITVYKDISGDFYKGMSINLSGLGFTCPPYRHDLVQSTEDGFVNTGTASRQTAENGTTYDPSTGLLVLDIGSGNGTALSAETTFTATNGTQYDPRTGYLTIVTTVAHGMSTGDYVKFVPDSLTFTCETDPTDPKTYPRTKDPVYNTWKQVSVINTTTFIMDVGASSDLSTHTFVSATANGVKKANTLVTIVDSSIVFTCGLDGDVSQKAYPRVSDPASNAIFGVEANTADTITVNIGTSSDVSVHNFVSATADAIVVKNQPNKFTSSIQSTYDPATGALVVDVEEVHGLTAATGLTAGAGTTYDPVAGTISVVTTGAHGMTTGDFVKFNEGSVTFTCGLDGDTEQKTYPRQKDPVFNKWIQIIVVNATTFTATIGTSSDTSVHNFVSGTVDGILRGNSIINIVDDSIAFSCATDNNVTYHPYPRATDPASNKFIGIESVTAETFTLNVGRSSDVSDHQALGSIISGFTSTSSENRYTAQAGTTYDPASGILVLNVGAGHGLVASNNLTAQAGTTYNPRSGVLQVVTTAAHLLTTGDYVRIEPNSLTFTCDTDDNNTNHTYPRTSDPINNVWKQVNVVNSTTFNIDIGRSSDVSNHTFVSAVADGIKSAASLISIVDNSLTFTCDTDGNTVQYAYPRFTDPASGKILGIDATTVDTISVNVGRSSDTSVHDFVSGVANGIIERFRASGYTALTGSTYDDGVGTLVIETGTSTSDLTAPDTFTADNGTTYNPVTGVMRVVTSAANDIQTGDLVKITEGAVRFSCDSDSNATIQSYPRATDPIFNKWMQAIRIDGTTFEINVGSTVNGNYVHTFQGGTNNGILKANSVFNIVDDSISFICGNDNYRAVKSYPEFTSSFSNRFIGVEAVSGNSFTVNVGQGNLATFPDNFGRVFQINEVIAGAGTSFSTYVGVSTIPHTYKSGGNTETFVIEPFDGQVVYFDEIYNSIKSVTITDGGSGYVQAPTVTFSLPSEPWGVQATGVARLTGDRVSSVDIISNGRGYTGTPTVSFTGNATGTPEILPTYYVVSSATPIVGGISTVTFTENVPYAIGVGSTVPFFKQSRVLASSQAFEYIGSGNTFPDALPARGGVAIPENEIVNKNGGLVIFTSTDQAGNFKIGEGVIINQLEGSITGDAYNRSLFANITPYILALGGGD